MAQKTRIELQQDNSRLGAECYALRKQVGDLELEIATIKARLREQAAVIAPDSERRGGKEVHTPGASNCRAPWWSTPWSTK